MLALCTDCIVDPNLREILQATATGTTCILCSATVSQVIDLEDRHAKSLMRALIRYHFEEMAYNSHFGGESIERILRKPNPIVRPADPEKVEDLCQAVYAEGYEGKDQGVSLFAGYFEGSQNPLLGAMRDSDDHRFVELRRRLASENWFHAEADVKAMLSPFQTAIATTLNTGTFWRARIGYDVAGYDAWSGGETTYVPFSGDQIGAPPPPLASGGRVNRPGVSFLYVASDVDTAVAEVRPHPGHVVSVGRFDLRAAVRIADFRRVNLAQYCDSDAELDNYQLLHTIERDFATPVTPDQRTHYMLGQLIADVLRQLGFDGVAYRSSVASGTNYCFFDPAHCENVPSSAQAIRVLGLQYATKAEPSIAKLTSRFTRLKPR